MQRARYCFPSLHLIDIVSYYNQSFLLCQTFFPKNFILVKCTPACPARGGVVCLIKRPNLPRALLQGAARGPWKERAAILKFTLYSSGIALAQFCVTGEDVLFAPRASGELGFPALAPMSEADDAPFFALTHMRPFALLTRLPMLCAAVRGGAPGFVLSQARYTREREGCYIQRGVKFPCNLLFDGEGVFAFVCPCREACGVLVREGCETQTPLALWEPYRTRRLYAVSARETFRVPMRDGAFLAADVYLPQGAALPVPAILVRTPYDRDDGPESYFRYVRRGYAVVVQDVRGRNGSDGAWRPFCSEIEDGDDTLTWLAGQPFCDGSIGMLGGSYLGYTQWCAAALGNEHLKAMISVVTAGTAFVDGPLRGGCLSSGGMAWNFAMTKRRFAPERMERSDWDEVLDRRPLSALPRAALGQDVPFWNEELEHPCEDAFWLQGDWVRRSTGRPVPVLIQSGWFDDNGMGTTQALALTQSWPAGMRKVVLGPWQHSGNSRYDLHALSFPENALRFDLDLLYQQWFDHFLRGEDNGVERTAPVEYYTIGENRWKSAREWPVEHADDIPFYFGENGGLFPVSGRAGKTGYTYDPRHPAVHLIDMSENEIEVPEDYTAEEQRPDYALYTSPPLSQPLTVTGDALVHLWVSSDAPDTDFMVRLCDVDESGRSVKLADGILAARFRDGFAQPHWLEPGQVVHLAIRTTKISCRFAPGHRLRVSVTSSAKHFVFPCTNTTDPYDGAPRTAHNTIWHGGETPSCIVLRIER